MAKIIRATEPAQANARPFGLADVAVEARRLLEAARRQAAALRDAAAREATALRDAARAEGFRQGLAEGRAQGLREGLEEGRRNAAAEFDRQTASAVPALAALLGELQARRRDIEDQARTALVALALDIAALVIRRETSCGPDVARLNLRRAVELSASRANLEVFLNPADLAAVDAFLPELRKSFAGLSILALHEDPSVSPGGCVVRTAQGSVDADIRTQLDEIRNLLLGTDT
jgi:flagellar assembly protein FliH